MAGDFKEVVIEIRGSKSIYIENYRKILEYTSQSIRLLTKNGPLQIQGKNLRIRYYTGEDMQVSGTVYHIHMGVEQRR